MSLHNSANIHSLPTEIIYIINRLALNASLLYVSKRIYLTLSHAPPNYTAHFLVAHTIQHHKHSFLAEQSLGALAPNFYTPAVILAKSLMSPLCTVDVLRIVHQIIKPLFKAKSSGRDDTEAVPICGVGVFIEDESKPYALCLPRRLWSDLEPPDPSNPSITDIPLYQTRCATPLPMLKFLFSLQKYYKVNINSGQGYALAKTVFARESSGNELVRFLLRNGANPTLKDGFAIKIAIRRKSLGLVQLLIRSWPSASMGFDARAEVALKQDLLLVAVKVGARDIVRFLVKEKGWSPNLQTLNFLEAGR